MRRRGGMDRVGRLLEEAAALRVYAAQPADLRDVLRSERPSLVLPTSVIAELVERQVDRADEAWRAEVETLEEIAFRVRSAWPVVSASGRL